MEYNIHDLNNAVRSVDAALERRAQARGEALANRVLARSRSGRGLWFIVL